MFMFVLSSVLGLGYLIQDSICVKTKSLVESIHPIFVSQVDFIHQVVMMSQVDSSHQSLVSQNLGLELI